MAVVSCSVCPLASISNAVPATLINPQWFCPAALRDEWLVGWRLHTQHAPKNDSATSKRRGPMIMGGLFNGNILAKPKAPTRVMLMPASSMQSPKAQHRAGDVCHFARRNLLCPDFFTGDRCGSLSEQIIFAVGPPYLLSLHVSMYLRRQREREIDSK